MNTNLYQKEESRKRPGFWRSQFSDTPALSQTIFDVVIGIVAPILCLYFDPIVFRGDPSPCNFSGPLLKSLAPFGYTSIGIGILALAVWLIAGRRISRGTGFLAGVFFAGAAFAVILGIIMLPFSILGLLLAGLGALGFIPFLTAFVYLRNGVRAWRRAALQDPEKLRIWLLGTVLTAALIVFGVAALVQWQTSYLFPQTQTVEQPNSCGSE